MNITTIRKIPTLFPRGRLNAAPVAGSSREPAPQNTLSRFDYANDALGRRTARTWERECQLALSPPQSPAPAIISTTDFYGYNARSELVSATRSPADDPSLYYPEHESAYEYDAIGNRVSSAAHTDSASYTANSLNQYASIIHSNPNLGGGPSAYDLDGNLLSDGVFSYTWDAENRLISVASNNIAVAAYSYDHRSRRIAKQTAAGSTAFKKALTELQKLADAVCPCPWHMVLLQVFL
jgi:YD repeat-containing protein